MSTAATPGRRAAPRPARQSNPAKALPRPASRRTDPTQARPASSGYLAQTERPWTSLLIALPMVVVYELYTSGWLGSSHVGSQHITAFLLTEELFNLLGASGRHLPSFVLVAMLLGAHIARRDTWRVDVFSLLASICESLLWSLPLLFLGWATARYLPLAGQMPAASHNTFVQSLALSCGAGVYEELVFRLLGMTLLIVLLRDAIGLPRWPAMTLAIGLTATAFSLYHFIGYNSHWATGPFVFRTLAGAYFGGLFYLRGFGLTALCHMIYDIAVLSMFAG